MGSKAAELVNVRVYPEIERRIKGEAELDRESLFAICDAGANIDRNVPSEDVLSYILDDLEIDFGRLLSPVRTVVGHPEKIVEDTEQPGFVDLEWLRLHCEKNKHALTPELRGRLRRRLDVASHGLARSYPEFMGAFTTPAASKDDKKHRHFLPANAEAAAQYAAAVFEYGFGDYARPKYYEPINEPHWSFIPEQQLADWHLQTKQAFADRQLDVKVGGPCLSVAYFYKREYGALDGLMNFMRNTEGTLDFYSFHVYDYLRWENDDLVGRITSGLPLEGVLDLVQASAVREFGREYSLVVSEQGGYISGVNGFPTSDEIADRLAAEHFPGEGFDHEMQKRSIASHVLVSTAIANTLVFMDHPHVIEKAVPFILLESMHWDPKYYSTLYTAYDFKDRKRWVESANSDFYKFFAGLKGRRAFVKGGDPDLQLRAFVEEDHLRVVVNNLSNKPHEIALEVPSYDSATVRRYRRRIDYRPELLTSDLESAGSISIEGREALLLDFKLAQTTPVSRIVDEIPFYANEIAVKAEPGKSERFIVNVDDQGEVAYGELRISLTRKEGADRKLRVKLNGKTIQAPVEDAAPRYDDSEYASTRIIRLDRSQIRNKNRVDVRFADGGAGAIGSVVLRVGFVQDTPKQTVGLVGEPSKR